MFRGMQEIVVSVHNLERLRSNLMDIGRWSCHPLPDAPPIPYEYLMLLGTAIQGRTPLSFNEQDSIVRQLRQALRDEKNETILGNVRSLLKTLRQRPEVTFVTVSEINALLGDDAVSVDAADRDAYAHDLWPRQLLATRGGLPRPAGPRALLASIAAVNRSSQNVPSP